MIIFQEPEKKSKKPVGGVSMFGGVDMFAAIKKRKPEPDSDEEDTQEESKKEQVQAPVKHAVPKQKDPLFGDEDDLFSKPAAKTTEKVRKCSLILPFFKYCCNYIQLWKCSKNEAFGTR